MRNVTAGRQAGSLQDGTVIYIYICMRVYIGSQKRPGVKGKHRDSLAAERASFVSFLYERQQQEETKQATAWKPQRARTETQSVV